MEERNDMVHVSLWLPKELVEAMDSYGIGRSRSEKVRDILCSEFKQRDYLLHLIEENQRKIVEMQSALQNNIFSEEYEVSKAEKDFFAETIQVLKAYPEVVSGRCNLFNNTFNRRLTIGEFKLLLEKMRQ